MQVINAEDIADEWHPIEESPKYGGTFIVWIEPAGTTTLTDPSGVVVEFTMQFAFAIYSTVTKHWIVEGDFPDQCRITHWRPAPDRPEL